MGDDADCLDALQLDQDLFDLMHSADLRPEFIYASKKTNRLISESNGHLPTPAELKDWDEAVQESRCQMKKFVRPVNETELDDWRTWVVEEAVRAAELILLAAAAGDGDEAKSLTLGYAHLVQQKVAVLVRSMSDTEFKCSVPATHTSPSK